MCTSVAPMTALPLPRHTGPRIYFQERAENGSCCELGLPDDDDDANGLPGAGPGAGCVKPAVLYGLGPAGEPNGLPPGAAAPYPAGAPPYPAGAPP